MSLHIRTQARRAVCIAIHCASGCIFDDRRNDQAFEGVLGEAITRDSISLLAYCITPNHFRLVLWTQADGSPDDGQQQFLRFDANAKGGSPTWPEPPRST